MRQSTLRRRVTQGALACSLARAVAFGGQPGSRVHKVHQLGASAGQWRENWQDKTLENHFSLRQPCQDTSTGGTSGGGRDSQVSTFTFTFLPISDTWPAAARRLRPHRYPLGWSHLGAPIGANNRRRLPL